MLQRIFPEQMFAANANSDDPPENLLTSPEQTKSWAEQARGNVYTQLTAWAITQI